MESSALPKCRVFLALPFSEEFREELTGVQKNLTRKFSEVHWIEEENFHLTLRFFGELTSREIEKVIETINPIAENCDPFEFNVSRLNYFGTISHPRVLYCEPEELPDVFWQIADALEDEFPDPDGRKLTPHVTIAKFRKREQVKVSSAQQYERMLGDIKAGDEEEDEELPEWASFEPLTDQIEELVLYETVWEDKKVNYVPFERWPLGKKKPEETEEISLLP